MTYFVTGNGQLLYTEKVVSLPPFTEPYPKKVLDSHQSLIDLNTFFTSFLLLEKTFSEVWLLT